MKEIKRWMRQCYKIKLRRVGTAMPRSQINIVRVSRIISSQMHLSRPRVEESNRMSECAIQNERNPKMCSSNLNSAWAISRTRNNWLPLQPKSHWRAKERTAHQAVATKAILKDLTLEEQAPSKKKEVRSSKRRVDCILRCKRVVRDNSAVKWSIAPTSMLFRMWSSSRTSCSKTIASSLSTYSQSSSNRLLILTWWKRGW